jgi:hypothetical protein
MKNQSAVEWLVSILNKEGFAPVLTNEEIQQAKEMEQEQTIEFADSFYDNCVLQYGGLEKSAEQYYNEAFKK